MISTYNKKIIFLIAAIIIVVSIGFLTFFYYQKYYLHHDSDSQLLNHENTQNENAADDAAKYSELNLGQPLTSLEYTEDVSEYVVLHILHGGDIVIKLYPDIAPITVNNFQTLVKEKFYDGLTFHRVVPDFVIQGGDPKGDGTGGSGHKIKGEFLENGVYNNLAHKRGVISMARAADPDSASSQFFIVLNSENGATLNGKYAGFGEVISGMDVVDSIAKVSTKNEKPVIDIKIAKAEFVTPDSAKNLLTIKKTEDK